MQRYKKMNEYSWFYYKKMNEILFMLYIFMNIFDKPNAEKSIGYITNYRELSINYMDNSR